MIGILVALTVTGYVIVKERLNAGPAIGLIALTTGAAGTLSIIIDKVFELLAK